MFCSACGLKNEESSKFCGGCGFNLIEDISGEASASISAKPSEQEEKKDMLIPSVPPKSALLAAFLSFLFIGVGQFYIGQTGKFLVAFTLAILLIFSGILSVFIGLIWIIMIFDAYFVAKKLASGTAVKKWDFFWN